MFSLQGRTPYYKGMIYCAKDLIDPTLLSKKQAIPGPGSYEPKSAIDKFGVYHLSNQPNSKAPQISPRGERFKDEL